MGTKKKGLLNASERDGVEYRKVKLWEIVCGRANNGVGVSFYMLIGFASMIATEGYGIAMALAGMLVTGSRIFDGFIDPAISFLFERTRLKNGKLRFFLILGWVIESLSLLVMYQWAAGKFDGVLGVAVFLISYLVYAIGYTIQGVADNTMCVVITNDPTQRPMVGFWGTVYNYAVPLIYTNLQALYVLPKYDNQFSLAFFGETVWWYVGISFVCLAVSCIGVRRIDVEETFRWAAAGEKKDDKVRIRDIIAVIKDNRNVQMYMVAGISDKLAQQTMSASIVTTLLNGVLIGSYIATTMVGNVSKIVGLIFAFSGGLFMAKMGAKKATTVWSAVCIGGAAATLGLFLILGGPDGMKALGVMGLPVILYAGLDLLRTGGTMVLTMAGTAMRADLADYENVRSGKFMPSVVASAYLFIDQMVSSLGSTIAAVCISTVGYVNTVPQMGDEATWPKFWITMFLFLGMPVIGWMLNLIAMKFYTLDREKMIEVQKTISARKKAVEKGNAADGIG